MKNRLYSFCISFILVSSFTYSQTFKNPIIPGFYPDPSICKVDDDYYLVNSSFSFFPGVPIFHSRNLVNWKQIGYCLTTTNQLPLQGGGISDGIWAPTIRYFKGVFYMVTTNMTEGKHLIVTATNPAGPWSPPIWINEKGIDPSLFFDDDGTCYFTRNGKDKNGKLGIIQYKIDPNTGKKLSEEKLIHGGVFDPYAEGPHLYKINGWYYLMMAEGGTHAGHMETIARSKNPFGPFENGPQNPILTQRTNLFEHVQATGHGDLIQDNNGKWWMVFLGIRNNWGLPMRHNLGRETFLSPVTWQNGWPLVNYQKPITIYTQGHLQNDFETNNFETYDDFTVDKLPLHWNFLRNPDSTLYSLKQQVGYLSIKCAENTLETKVQSPVFLGRRQQHFYSSFSTKVIFNPVADNEEAGIAVFSSERFFIQFGIKKENSQLIVFVRRKADDILFIPKSIPINSDPIELKIQSTPWSYHFAFKQKDGDFIDLYKAESMFMTSEIAGGFVGNFYALYASGNGIKSNNAALFDWVDYTYDKKKETKL